MLIFPQAFVLTEAATATPLTHPRIGYQSWLRDLAATAVTVSTQDADFPADAPLREDTAEAWKPTALPATWKVDLGTSREVDYVALLGVIGSVGCAVKVETSTDDVSYSLFASEVSPADDAPLMFLDDAVICRWIKLTFTGAVMPKLAVAFAGQVLKVQRAIYGGVRPPSLARQTVLQASTTRGGQFLGQGFRRHGVAGSIPFQRLTASWYRTNFDPFVKHARKFPYFVAWRPESFPLEVIYAWSGEDIQPANTGPRDFMAVDVGFVGVGHE